MENRPMTRDELLGYTGSVSGFVMDDEEYEARLYVAAPLDGRKEWYLYGDIQAGFDLDEDGCVPDENGDFGNYRVRRIIEQSEIDLTDVELDPEGGCFFAYGDTRERMEKLAADINGLSVFRRMVVA